MKKLRIPKEIITFPKLWEERPLSICAMNRGCFIIIPAQNVERMYSKGMEQFWVPAVHVKSTEKYFTVPLSEMLQEFYLLNHPETKVDVLGHYESLNEVYVSVTERKK